MASYHHAVETNGSRDSNDSLSQPLLAADHADLEEREVVPSTTSPVVVLHGYAGKATPIPKLQIFFVAIWRLSIPMAFSVIMPFINSMLVELGISDEVHVGHFSGPVETASAVGTILGVLIFARLSDMYGRKPVVLSGVACSAVFCGLFGFSRSYWQMMLLRFLTGFASAAQGACSKVMAAELSDSTNVSINVALSGHQIGRSVAPLIAALFSHPERIWRIFESTAFERHPYSLPCVVSALIPGVTVIFAVFLSVETHPVLKCRGTFTQSALPGEHGMPLMRGPSPKIRGYPGKDNSVRDSRSLPGLWSCGVLFILFLWLLHQSAIVALQASEILLFFSSTTIGGIDLSHWHMSLFLSLKALLGCICDVVLFPRLSRRWSPEAVLRRLTWLPPLTCALYLFLSSTSSESRLPAWILLPALALSVALQMVADSLFLAIDVLIPARAPTSAQLSLVNALGEITSQLAVGIGSSAGASLFALSAGSRNPMWRGKLVWAVLIGYNLGTAVVSQRLSHIDGWREKEEGRKVVHDWHTP